MFNQKTILVTGGNKGIGLEICRQLALIGQKVIMSGRNEKALNEAVQKISSRKENVHIELLDILDIPSYSSFYEKINATDVPIDILINNAAVFLNQSDDVKNISYDTFDLTIRTNTYGPIFLSQTFLSQLISKKGRIINISSELGIFSKMGQGFLSYRISKTAINAFTINLAKECPEIKVVAAHPGRVNTDMSGSKTGRDPSKAAEHIVWLTTSPKVESGKMYFDEEVIDW